MGEHEAVALQRNLEHEHRRSTVERLSDPIGALGRMASELGLNLLHRDGAWQLTDATGETVVAGTVREIEDELTADLLDFVERGEVPKVR